MSILKYFYLEYKYLLLEITTKTWDFSAAISNIFGAVYDQTALFPLMKSFAQNIGWFATILLYH